MSVEENMKNNISLLRLGMLVILIILACQHTMICQKSEDLLNRKIELDDSNITMLFVLGKLAYKYRVPIGFERTTDYYEKLRGQMDFENGEVKWKNNNFHIKSGTLEEILNSIIAQEPQYKWELRDGVINVFPIKARDSFLKAFLETKIIDFYPEKGISKFKVRDAIIDLPNVKTLLKKENVEILKRDYLESNYLYPDDEIEISISNSDVRGILNKIIGDSVHKFWLVERIGDKKESLLVSF